MLDRDTLIEYLEQHLDGALSIEDLAAWANDVYRAADFEPEGAELIEQVLSVVRDSVDSHRFNWEEPDFAGMIAELSELDSPGDAG